MPGAGSARRKSDGQRVPGTVVVVSDSPKVYPDYQLRDTSVLRRPVDRSLERDVNVVIDDMASEVHSMAPSALSREVAIDSLPVEQLLWAVKEFQDGDGDGGGTLELSRESITRAQREEQSAKRSWIDAVASLTISRAASRKLRFLSEIEEQTEKIATWAQVSAGELFCHFALVGPRGSGKTTLLNLTAGRIAHRVCAMGVWRQTFLLFLDFAKLTCRTPTGIFKFVVETALQQLGAQFSPLGELGKKIADHFVAMQAKAAPRAFPPRLPVERVAEFAHTRLTRLAESMPDAERELRAFLDWTFRLPQEVAKVFKLTTTHVFIDHIDAFDFEVESESAIERLKFFLRGSSYIVACRDEQSFHSALGSGLDLLKDIVFFNVSDTPARASRDGTTFLVTYSSGRTIRLNRALCAGCIAYNAEWTQMVRVAREAVPEGDDPAIGAENEQTHVLIDRLTTFIPLVIASHELPPGRIERVQVLRDGVST